MTDMQPTEVVIDVPIGSAGWFRIYRKPEPMPHGVGPGCAVRADCFPEGFVWFSLLKMKANIFDGEPFVSCSGSPEVVADHAALKAELDMLTMRNLPWDHLFKEHPLRIHVVRGTARVPNMDLRRHVISMLKIEVLL